MDDVKENIISVVKGFNDLVAYLQPDDEDDSSETGDSTDEADNSIFEGSNSANRLAYKLKSMLTTTIIDSDSAYTSLADIGLEFDSDGNISIDEETLDEAIEEDPEALRALFLGDDDQEIEGIADILNDAITDMVDSSGIASTEIDDAEERMEAA